MLNCVTNKLTIFSHSKLPLSLNNFQKCVVLLTPKTDFSTSSNVLAKSDDKPSKWLSYNDIVYPPQEPGEEKRPAVCYLILSCIVL